MLHIVNKSPFQTSTLQTCLEVAQGGDVLLIEDAVCAAVPGTLWEDRLLGLQTRFTFHVLRPDLEARGWGEKLIAGVHAVDYTGFVALVEANATCQSWL